MPVSTPVYHVDAFTDRPFGGNPAAVCLLDVPADADWMQGVAREMNLSDTAFLVPNGEGFDIRWFTPRVEVPLCGHATLAAAHVLWERGDVAPEAEVRFTAGLAVLRAMRAGDWIVLDFPLEPPREAPEPEGLAAALGARLRYVGRNRLHMLAEVEPGDAMTSEDVVRALAPDMQALAALVEHGIIVTARASSATYDFVSRFFAPAAGVDEDPVTGSAHCGLAAYWRDRLGRTEFEAYQASARGGRVRVSIHGDRAHIAGQAVTVAEGALRV